jgi:Tfp pilus assembly ATPase PilU
MSGILTGGGDSPLVRFLGSNAETLILSVGLSPLMVREGRLERIAAQALHPDEVLGPIKCTTPERHQDELREGHSVQFVIRDREDFQVTACWREGDRYVVLRRESAT